MTLRVAAIGLGWVAQHRHLPVMDRSGRFDVVGVVDRHPGVARDVAKTRRYRYHGCTDTLADIAWLDEVDAVTISTAPMAHHGLAVQALALGKHVLTEKPFTMTSAEGAELIARAQEADRRLAVVHNFQFARSTKALFADLADGRLGDITGIDAVQFGNPDRRLPEWCEELPFGLFYDESPHLLYLLRAVVGDIALARAFKVASTRGLRTPARVEAWFRGGPNNCPVRLACNFESPVSEWYLMVGGSRGYGIVDIFRDIYVRLPNDGLHDTGKVLRTSAIATAQHWLQHVTSGIPHLSGRLNYGNGELFDRFARAVAGDVEAMAPISAQAAHAILTLQHAIIDGAEDLYA
ncbi:Gfo/Idh/MocA family protein [Sphingomonas oligophenolica]|uniref:Gfo/Idh/MocA family protein n=1 Tax=Sphingomonas oligophenolica TaxID=301154 RepID=UPI0019D6A4AB|nr:Gfo/Idh/MocA family oxidoreductase [Sphingomonas oligophenolica]